MPDHRPKRVFVMGAHIPNGGTYMAYQLGRVVCGKWGHELVAVEIDPGLETHSVWSYEHRSRKATLEEMAQQAGRDDLLIANPSFSDYMTGLSFPGKKLMYVQGVTTFAVLDGFFDKYVATSHFVREFVLRTYGMALPVIAPFIHHDHSPDPLPAWNDRPERSVAVGLKQHGDRFLDHFSAVVATGYPDLEFATTIIPNDTPHRSLLGILSENRYFLSLSAVEGFGLMPLEAMMCGAATVGFHGCGGDYFRHGENALVCGYPDFQQLAELLARLLADDPLAVKLSCNGERTASGYTFERFRNAWVEELAPLLD